MKEVFQELWIFKSDKEFLEKLKHEGFYLEDLCDEPINHLPRKARKAKRSENIENLANKIKELKPEIVIVVMKAIQGHVKKALYLANVKPKYYCIPFPTRQYIKVFKKELKEILTEII